jgi:predicted nucleic acid-binding protein
VISEQRHPVRRYVLDANALIAFFENRPGAGQRVRQLMEGALRTELPLLLSAVNWGEVFYLVWRLRGEDHARQAEARLKQLPIAVVAADVDRATRAGGLKQKHNLGCADAFAAELTIERGAWLVTADPEFGRLEKILSIHPLPRYQS